MRTITTNESHETKATWNDYWQQIKKSNYDDKIETINKITEELRELIKPRNK